MDNDVSDIFVQHSLALMPTPKCLTCNSKMLGAHSEMLWFNSKTLASHSEMPFGPEIFVNEVGWY